MPSAQELFSPLLPLNTSLKSFQPSVLGKVPSLQGPECPSLPSATLLTVAHDNSLVGLHPLQECKPQQERHCVSLGHYYIPSLAHSRCSTNVR